MRSLSVLASVLIVLAFVLRAAIPQTYRLGIRAYFYRLDSIAFWVLLTAGLTLGVIAVLKKARAVWRSGVRLLVLGRLQLKRCLACGVMSDALREALAKIKARRKPSETSSFLALCPSGGKTPGTACIVFA